MIRPGKIIRRRWLRIALGLAALGAVIGWAIRDPWPPRLVLLAPDSSSELGGFSPDGRSYLTQGDSGRISWDLATGQPTHQANFLYQTLIRSFSRDGRSFVANRRGMKDGVREVILEDVASRQVRGRLAAHSLGVYQASLVREDHALLAVMGDNQGGSLEVATLDLDSGVESRSRVAVPPDFVGPLAVSPDGRFMVHMDGTHRQIRFWDIEGNRLASQLPRNSGCSLESGPKAIYLPDGNTLVVARSDGQAEFWDLANSRLIQLIRLHPESMFPETWEVSADRRILLSVARPLSMFGPRKLPWYWRVLRRLVTVPPEKPTGEVVVLDLVSGQIVARSPGSWMAELAPDGRTVVTREPDGRLSVRDVTQARGR